MAHRTDDEEVGLLATAAKVPSTVEAKSAVYSP
jgi:hypothetical protein